MSSPFKVGTDALLGDELWSLPMPTDEIVVERRIVDPFWPARVAALDARIAALEGRIARLEARTITAIYRRCLSWLRSLWRRV